MDLEFIVNRLVVELMNKNFTIATAEECTCGLIGAAIASKESPQRWYKGSVICYTRESINKLLAVPLYVIEKNGLVSSQVAQQMAFDILYKYSANIGIGVVGSVENNNSDVQICVAKMNHSNLKFAYKKLTITDKCGGERLEEIIKETLILAIEHIMED